LLPIPNTNQIPPPPSLTVTTTARQRTQHILLDTCIHPAL
jgi:hypothetical protein